jgi:hypothetical protein
MSIDRAAGTRRAADATLRPTQLEAVGCLDRAQIHRSHSLSCSTIVKHRWEPGFDIAAARASPSREPPPSKGKIEAERPSV